MDFFPELYLHSFRITIAAAEELHLPEFKGSALRGVFGHVLRRLACTIPGEECARCPFRARCAYGVLFESSPPPGFLDAGKYRDIPRPYLFNPPLTRQRIFQRGDRLSFGVVLIGSAVAYLPHLVIAFEEIGRQGMRDGRGRFTIAGVESIDPHGMAASIYDGGVLAPAMTPIRLADAPPLDASATTAIITFLTPARIDIAGKLRNAPPTFTQLAEMVARRCALLAAAWCDGPAPPADPLAGLRESAQSVRLVDSDIAWRDEERHSSRQQARMQQGGIVGTVVYHGPVGACSPLLNAAWHLNIGKSTTFGLGRITVNAG